jgi:hypothetical protein
MGRASQARLRGTTLTLRPGMVESLSRKGCCLLHGERVGKDESGNQKDQA